MGDGKTKGGSIDAYAAYLKESAKKNDERWKATYQEYRGLTFTLAVNQMNADRGNSMNML